jgi:hypothetical protein
MDPLLASGLSAWVTSANPALASFRSLTLPLLASRHYQGIDADNLTSYLVHTIDLKP